MPQQFETLAPVPMFRSLKRAEVDALDKRCAWRHVRSKEWVIDYQDQGIDVFFVVTGSVRVLIYSKSGREVILADIDSVEAEADGHQSRIRLRNGLIIGGITGAAIVAALATIRYRRRHTK